MESGTVLYKGNHCKRITQWGWHCEWPPGWVQLTPEVIEAYTPGELEELQQEHFQVKCAEALEVLYEIRTNSLEDLMENSRTHSFWICGDGVVVVPSLDLWEAP